MATGFDGMKPNAKVCTRRIARRRGSGQSEADYAATLREQISVFNEILPGDTHGQTRIGTSGLSPASAYSVPVDPQTAIDARTPFPIRLLR